MKSILSLKELKKKHPGGEAPYLFAGVTAQISEPEIVAVLGASGQGKSTLLRVLALLDRLDEGEIRLHDRPSSEWQPREWRMKVCYVAQHPVMLPGSVEDNLRAVSVLHRKAFDVQTAKALMSGFGLEGLDWSKNASGLSGGEKQRVALVRAMLLRPEVFLLDEITASLDLHSKRAVEQVLMEWHRREGATLIWVTHDLEQARTSSGRVWFMGDGTLLEDADTRSFFQQPTTAPARRFLQLSGEGEPACPL